MTNEEINRAVAESVGFNWWAVEKGGWYYRQGGAGYTNRIEEAGRYTEANARKLLARGEPMSVRKIPHPDYCNDLNAMHEVVCKLPDGEPRDCYLRELQIVTQTWEKVDNDDDDDWLWHSANATARQRAEAYLRTIGKWRDA
jgi:hypothetical protein